MPLVEKTCEICGAKFTVRPYRAETARTCSNKCRGSLAGSFAPFPYLGDAMAYAKAHVAAGVLRIDFDGSIWRTAEHRRGAWQPVEPRRTENVGGKGYLRIALHVPGHGLVQVMAHRLVYEVLVGPIPDGLEIDHKNDDKKDNRPTNLEPVTGLENMRRAHARGRTKPWSRATTWRGRPRTSGDDRAKAAAMRADGKSLKAIAGALGISVSHAHRLATGGAP